MSTAQTEREGKGEKRGVSELCLYIGRGEEEEERGFFAAPPPLSPILCDKKPSRFLTCAPPPHAGAKENKNKNDGQTNSGVLYPGRFPIL